MAPPFLYTMKIKTLPSVETILKYLDVDVSEGKATWKERTEEDFLTSKRPLNQCKIWNAVNAGKEAGPLRPNGYHSVSILGERYLLHRIIWKVANGKEPDFIDHIDGNPKNNRIDNLRSVTRVENCRNTKRRKGCSGKAGVRKYNETSWQVHIGNGYVTTCRSEEEAVAIRNMMEVYYGYHENHGREQ